jgi:hypothetical protein
MMLYQLIKNKPDQIMFTNGVWQGIIPVDPANTDYAKFKREINADEAQLQDADGNTMTAAEAKAYIATLP